MPNIRPMKLPQDIDLWIHLNREGFQYPENPEWNVETDEIEGTVDTLNTVKRVWPLLAILRFFISDVHDIGLGFIYEEDGQPLGNVTYERRRGGRSGISPM